MSDATFTDPAPIGNAFGPGRDAVVCCACGAVVLTATGDEPDWLDLHRRFHRGVEDGSIAGHHHRAVGR